jgi:hypothetical protein
MQPKSMYTRQGNSLQPKQSATMTTSTSSMSNDISASIEESPGAFTSPAASPAGLFGQLDPALINGIVLGLCCFDFCKRRCEG